jgi:hypothetical protein
MTAHKCGRWIPRARQTPASCVEACVRPILRTLLLLLAVLLLVLPAGAAAQVLQADFDGDGVRDAVFRGARPDVLCVQLSRTPQPEHLRFSRQVVRFATADIDADGDRDIVATTTEPGLDIFLNLGRGRFRAVHAAPVPAWKTGQRIQAAAAGPQSDNPSDAPAGPAIVRGRSLHGRSPAILLLPLAPVFAARQLSRGADLRGPPRLSS